MSLENWRICIFFLKLYVYCWQRFSILEIHSTKPIFESQIFKTRVPHVLSIKSRNKLVFRFNAFSLHYYAYRMCFNLIIVNFPSLLSGNNIYHKYMVLYKIFYTVNHAIAVTRKAYDAQYCIVSGLYFDFLRTNAGGTPMWYAFRSAFA